MTAQQQPPKLPTLETFLQQPQLIHTVISEKTELTPEEWLEAWMKGQTGKEQPSVSITENLLAQSDESISPENKQNTEQIKTNIANALIRAKIIDSASEVTITYTIEGPTVTGLAVADSTGNLISAAPNRFETVTVRTPPTGCYVVTTN